MNCMDSLDRTNVGMSKIAFKVLQKQITRMGFSIKEAYGEQCAKESIAFAEL